MKKVTFLLWSILALTVGILPAAGSLSYASEAPPGRTMAKQATKRQVHWKTANHSDFDALKKEFSSGEEVTEACLSCHNETEKQIHQGIHWTWLAGKNKNGDTMGKAARSLNNFCISANKNEDKSCLDCHIGWGRETKSINCLVCHSLKDMNLEEGFEDFRAFSSSEDPEEIEIAEEIQGELSESITAIALPTRKNCGSCHFFGGGGDGVKHGDLDSSLTDPSRDLDVHMAGNGQNFSCTRCHTTVDHKISGRVYTEPAASTRTSLVQDDLASKITCESCHTDKPHKKNSKANDHTDKVACQSCHIPHFARELPTKMSWDWSQAGKLKKGKPYKTKDQFGKYDYLTIKGQMKWDKMVKPEYFWFNGSIDSLTASSTIDPSGPVKLSFPIGSPEDENSRIYPFKVHRGRQPSDKVHNILLNPMLGGNDGYWKTLDWDKALRVGQQTLALPYSGQFDFVDTTYVYPTTHMVAPKDNVVECIECHREKGGRLAGIGGVYMPARDKSQILDGLGWSLVFGSVSFVLLHGAGRVFSSKKTKREETR